MRGGESVEEIGRQKTYRSANVQRKTVFLVLDLAGNLDQAVLGIHDGFCLYAVELQRAGWSEGEFLAGEIDEDVVVAQDGGGNVDFGGHAGGDSGSGDGGRQPGNL